jgi:hypothetical protein
MEDPCITIVEGIRYSGDEFDLRHDLWDFALEQRYFGPRQLVVATGSSDGRVIGLVHCRQTEPREMALKYCLAALDQRPAVAVAYSDEPVSLEPPLDLRERFDAARAAAGEFGVHLVDWIMCDDIHIRSIKYSLEVSEDDWWDVPPPRPS